MSPLAPNLAPKHPYPPALTIDPSSVTGQHTHTFILLHGRGSNASRFGNELLASTSLATSLPTVKFVFPTASKRRATRFKRMLVNQWFDLYSLGVGGDDDERQDLQINGLCETGGMLRELVDREARILSADGYRDGYRRVVLGGLSQGCAVGVFTLLGGGFGEDERKSLGGFIGMSGWLPFQRQLKEMCQAGIGGLGADGGEEMDRLGLGVLSGSLDELARNQGLTAEANAEGDAEEDEGDCSGAEAENEDSQSESGSEEERSSPSGSIPVQTAEDDVDNDPFNPDGITTPQSPICEAINLVRDILDLPPLLQSGSPRLSPPLHLQTPIFLGHGTLDAKVSFTHGTNMSTLLATHLHMQDVTFKAYTGFGHWYKIPDEIDDIVSFARDKVGVPAP